ncbi:hypothetical protein M0D68_18835 [Paraburkholderia sp. SEWSISQ10-3 4]|uniref:hypothetical protein n=1 Tax=Paraburkholderia TaxID=1822464 RepID=UPI001AFFAF81|nr:MULTISPECIES: hypothetical protein [Paraburkholderia]MCX4140259.1 hypothetical protein [Paraburkholderia aspalathi]MDN7172946.1 hypothetical protein [Paraburkholderia sp. SEWSISQ10-3 4]MDQ6502585.1 hypothetical protein [Paraburkholderia aspalathi]CAE6772276.1 hypothetical protein R69746_03900 [Paraburkholderia aspalathi]
MRVEQAMTRTYEYHGYTLVVAVESDLSSQLGGAAACVGYVAIVRIFQADNAVAMFSPLRFGEAGGLPFVTEADALMGGYSAARRIVDDLFSHESQ